MIVVTGASGQLGTELRRLLGNNAQFLDRSRLDLSNPETFEAALRALKPEVLINAAAYTAVDLAEKERDLAFRLNRDAPARLAELSTSLGFKLIHLSTDYVFNGEAVTGGFTEEHPIAPLNTYGESKAAGEKEVLRLAPNALVVRTSWVHSAYGKNFVKTVLRMAAEKKPMRVVSDQIGSLTWAADLARTLLGAREASGLLHYSNEGVSSWYDVAVMIRHLRGLDMSIEPIATSEYPTPAKRPAFSLLNKSRIKSTLNLQIPHWVESLEKCLKEIS